MTAQSEGVNGQCQGKIQLGCSGLFRFLRVGPERLGRGLEAGPPKLENGWRTSEPPPKVDWLLSDAKGFSFSPSSGNCQKILFGASMEF